MEILGRKVDKIFLIFAGVCFIVLPFIVLLAFSYEIEEIKAVDPADTSHQDFDLNGKSIFVNYDQISKDYLEAASTGRTLEEFYSRRQYIGSPPYIPHKVDMGKNGKPECLVCHATGGWTEELKRNTPLTPHPENESCMQCHVKMEADALFVQTNWMSVSPPRLGRSYLPGAPPPIPHDLDRRGNCIACHVGPGAVAAIRVEHPARGNCRQCHVPDIFDGLFQRK